MWLLLRRLFVQVAVVVELKLFLLQFLPQEQQVPESLQLFFPLRISFLVLELRMKYQEVLPNRNRVLLLVGFLLLVQVFEIPEEAEEDPIAEKLTAPLMTVLSALPVPPELQVLLVPQGEQHLLDLAEYWFGFDRAFFYIPSSELFHTKKLKIITANPMIERIIVGVKSPVSGIWGVADGDETSVGIGVGVAVGITVAIGVAVAIGVGVLPDGVETKAGSSPA